MKRSVVLLSILLFFFTVPHTLEDFAAGAPQEAGIPVVAISLIVAALFSIQALGLYWIGQNHRRGLIAQAVVGLFWAIASGVAQLPTILSGDGYREGLISVLYVLGIIVVGILLSAFSLLTLRKAN